MLSRSLCLVHAHPDDESITTGGVIARARDDGHRVVVVTCTAGEEGEVHNLADPPRGDRLGEVRLEELRAACGILGVDRLELLGYRDSGMAGTPANDHPRSFHRACLDEAASLLARVLREERPDVVVTYTPDGTYLHPDHVKAHLVTVAALALLEREGWRPARVFWHAIPRSAVERSRERMAERDGGVHPAMGAVGVPDGEITTEVDVRGQLRRKRAAVAAHVTQVPPDDLDAMVGHVMDAMGGFEHFVLAGGHRAGRAGGDLFAGLAAPRSTAIRASV